MVVDFQSLYPSALIAYNLCYCTTFGRSELASKGGGQLGAAEHRFNREKFEKLLEGGNIINTPNDVLFLKTNIRKGVMPILLDEILSLRSFIKQTLKAATDERVKQILEARQLALKRFAACAFGYTNANYTGRMPCVELGDAIVEVSRHMLEFVIEYLEREYSELEVLYGDTDSLFIRMPPAPKEVCFDFAEQFCEEVTSFFPSPVRLKLERIYWGCFLVNKKRYCGWMYESKKQEKPVFDIKGLEMKRRDSCVLVANVMTEIIECVFRSCDADKAKSIFRSHIQRICTGNVPLNEFMLAREVRLGSYRGLEPPGAVVARRMMELDPKAGPMFGERVQFLVVSSVPGARLIGRVVSPEEFLEKSFRISTWYYIERQILPALGRCLETMGIDINLWMGGMKRELRKLRPYDVVGKAATAMERFCRSVECPLCNELAYSTTPVCANCLSHAGRTESLFELIQRIKACEKVLLETKRACSNCIGILGSTNAHCFCRGCDRFWGCKLAEEQFAALKSYHAAFQQICMPSQAPE
jgi:DNA polymerase zeta